MFRDERDALSAQVDSLELRLRETEQALKEATAGPKKERVIRRIIGGVFGCLLLVLGYLLAGVSTKTTTSSKINLLWKAQVSRAEGSYPDKNTPCQITIGLTHNIDPAASHQETIEATRWQITCGDQEVTVNDQKLNARYFVEEPTTEGTYRYHLKADIHFESASVFSIDTESKTALLSRPGYGVMAFTLDGPSEPRSGAPLQQRPWLLSPP